MDYKVLYKILSAAFLNLGASWYAAVFILPNFITLEAVVLNLIAALLNGTLLLVVAYVLEVLYVKYKY